MNFIELIYHVQIAKLDEAHQKNLECVNVFSNIIEVFLVAICGACFHLGVKGCLVSHFTSLRISQIRGINMQRQILSKIDIRIMK